MVIDGTMVMNRKILFRQMDSYTLIPPFYIDAISSKYDKYT